MLFLLFCVYFLRLPYEDSSSEDSADEDDVPKKKKKPKDKRTPVQIDLALTAFANSKK